MAPRPLISRGLRAVRIASVCALLTLASCASVKFERSTETSGTFKSVGWAFTIGSIDLPKSAMQIARENASDSNLANMRVIEARVKPNWGWWNWVLNIISIRRAEVSGTWGFEGDQ
jgi:hypothetical protein